jgi:hypothetical protein
MLNRDQSRLRGLISIALIVPIADAVDTAEGNTTERDHCEHSVGSAWSKTWHARNLLVREPGDLRSGCCSMGRSASGKARSRSQ